MTGPYKLAKRRDNWIAVVDAYNVTVASFPPNELKMAATLRGILNA